MSVRTRFAPSPTGYLHIGGVRTALYNWLFARQRGGQFILRIDDTDAARNDPETLQPILDGFRWLGIDWDEGAEKGGPHGPYRQSEKQARYHEAVQQLLARGLAYWDYATPEEHAAERAEAERNKTPWVYSRKWMATTAAERAAFEAQGRAGFVRLKMPREGASQFDDAIRGSVSAPWSSEQDHVIQRANGAVTYHLANVVDDFDMKITDVIRASEHLTNTHRQLFIIDGLGYPRPRYAHLPVVCEPGSKNKLSKRKLDKYLQNTGPAFKDFIRVYNHGVQIACALGLKNLKPETFNPIVVDFFKQVGYLPEAILNYMLLVGWAYDDKKELFSRQEMLDLFDLKKVNKDSGSFDAGKLWHFQEQYMKELPLETKVSMTLPYLQKAGIVPDPTPSDTVNLVRQVVEQAAHRLVTAGDVLEYDYFLVPDDRLSRDPKAVEKHLGKGDTPALLQALRALLTSTTPFTAPTLEARVKQFVEERQARLGDVNQAARVAVTGKATGFGTYETLALLGQQRCLARIDQALAQM